MQDDVERLSPEFPHFRGLVCYVPRVESVLAVRRRQALAGALCLATGAMQTEFGLLSIAVAAPAVLSAACVMLGALFLAVGAWQFWHSGLWVRPLRDLLALFWPDSRVVYILTVLLVINRL